MRVLGTIFILLLMAFGAMAQAGADYVITNLRPAALGPDGTTVTVSFDVNNRGTTASTIATVRMIKADSEEEIARENLRPLIANEGVTINLIIPMEYLSPDTPQGVLITVGIGEVETSVETLDNNSVEIIIPPLNQLEAQTTPVPPTPQPGPQAILEQLGFNTEDPVHRAALIGVGCALLMIFVLFLVILRLLFRRRRPGFELHVPPYANVPPMAPSSTGGRRQGWQFHAQNDQVPPYPSNEGATHIRKLLIGIDGLKLGNWSVTGMRMNQYDQYGRIARSEVIAARKHCRSLTKTAEKAPGLTEEQIGRRMRPIAKALVNQFQRKVNPRSAMLPIALDLAFQGVHGEVRIRFELFYLEQGRWRLVDSWEPEMTVAGKTIHENFTYSLHGLRQGEAFRPFTRRLQDDLTNLLTDMLKHEQRPDTGASRPIQM